MAVNEEALMWVEKYRPKNLNEVVDLHDIVESLKAFMRNPKNDASPYVRRHTGHWKNYACFVYCS